MALNLESKAHRNFNLQDMPKFLSFLGKTGSFGNFGRIHWWCGSGRDLAQHGSFWCSGCFWYVFVWVSFCIAVFFFLFQTDFRSALLSRPSFFVRYFELLIQFWQVLFCHQAGGRYKTSFLQNEESKTKGSLVIMHHTYQLLEKAKTYQHAYHFSLKIFESCSVKISWANVEAASPIL